MLGEVVEPHTGDDTALSTRVTSAYTNFRISKTMTFWGGRVFETAGTEERVRNHDNRPR